MRICAYFAFYNSCSSFEWKSGRENSTIHSSWTPPKSWYVDGSNTFYRSVEKKHVFTAEKSWLLAGRISQIPNPGDYIATEVLGEPIILANDHGQYKAFFNVCRHHAARICENGKNTLANTDGSVIKRFICPYHGWEYNIDGRLAKAVAMKGCEAFKARNFNLLPIRVDQLGPWLFVNFSEGRTSLREDQPDAQFVEDLLVQSGVGQLQHVGSRRYHLHCNWKVFIDNYLDGGLHVSIAHPSLAALLDMDSYTRQVVTSGAPDGTADDRRTDFKNANFFLQTCRSATAPSSSDLGKRSLTNVASLYLFHYPNLCVNRYGRWMDTNVVWPHPDRADQCFVDFDW